MVSQGIPGKLRTSTGCLDSNQKDKAKGSRKVHQWLCSGQEAGQKSLSTFSRCQNHPRQISSITDLGHCRAWGSGHCHCILFLTYLQVPGNISVYIWPSRPMFDAGLGSYLLCKSRTWVWRRAQASGGTSSRQETRAPGRDVQRFLQMGP